MWNLHTVKENVIPLVKEDGELSSDDQQTTDPFATYFNFQMSFYYRGYYKCSASTREGPKMGRFMHGLWKDEVLKRLQKLNEGKSPGPDGLHPLLLKESAASIAEPLAIIFSKSYESVLLPTDWKMAQVISIFKKGTKNDKANYRPASSTAIPYKSMESMIREKMLVFL